MKRLLLPTLAIFLGLASCQSPDLERARVPILWGMRLDAPAGEADFNPNLAKLREINMRDMALELPLLADSAGLPRIPALPLGAIKGLLLRHRVGLHLSFAPTATSELFPDGKLKASPDAWFASLRHELDSIMQFLEPIHPDRVVIGSNLGPVESHGTHWQSMFDSLRSKHNTLFSYGASPDHLRQITWLKANDELAVDYPPTAAPADDLKAPSRIINQGIQRILDSLHMPLYVFRANVMGENQTAQFQNRLRFWTPQTRYRGIALNTLYSRIPLRDSTSYYGLHDNPDFMGWLQEYRQRD